MRTAGRHREEQAALARILELDPEDHDARQRAAALSRQVHEQEYAAALAAGHRAVDEQRLQEARQALARAERRAPQHADTLALKEQVETLARNQDRDRHLAAAERAVGADDWQGALRAFRQAQALDPDYNQAVRGAQLAARIVAAQNDADEFLARPERLGTPAIATAARTSLSETAALAALSPRLQESRRALEQAIEAGQTPVPVRVISDNSTETRHPWCRCGWAYTGTGHRTAPRHLCL